MAFKPSDFKKTTRGSGEGRQLYPHQIRDERHAAAIGFAVAYFERMVGRRRAEFEAEALLEFFGDPRLARGLVAVLAGTYTWRALALEEALGPEAAAALARAGVARPADLRARLYALANARYGGFIGPEERRAALRELCAELAASAEERREWEQAPAPPTALLTPAHLERALTLDAEEEQVLVKLGAAPTPAEVADRYNFHSLETALAYAESARLRLSGNIWTILRSAHNLARRYRVTYGVGDLPGSLFDNRLDLTLHGSRDALGGWGRAGRRLARALLRLLAAHPGCAVEGEVISHAGGKRAVLRLDAKLLRALGAAAGAIVEADAWDDAAADELQRAWGRALVRGRTAGWRLRRDPDPVVGSAAVVVPDFALRRGDTSLALCLAPGRAAAEAVAAGLKGSGGAGAVVLAHESAAPALRGCKAPVVTYAERPADAIPRLAAALERAWPRGVLPIKSDPWEDLAAHVAVEGFVDEARAAAILGCAPGDLGAMVRKRALPGVSAIAGLGICSGDTLAEIREMLGRTAQERAA
jgi:predicted nuclease of restriction endonuclease-like RecB superfamily